MNFVKAMLVYMSLTLAASVQTGPIPEVTPEPTATPTAVVATATPAPTEVPTEAETPAPETPAPTEAPLPTAEITPVPVPEITPNKAYRNLKSGDRGDEVKAVQERLIELGYLEEGQADGAYGNLTRRAVMNFQYYNGLTRDGVAGDATQTYLFENPDVAENPLRPTDTPEPTATPGPTQTPRIVTIGGEATEAPEAGNLLPLPEAKVVLNDAGAPLSALVREEDVLVRRSPRLWRDGDELLLSLSDLAAAVQGWTLSRSETETLLSAAGYEVRFVPAEERCTVDGEAVALEPGSLTLQEGELLIRPGVLDAALHAVTVWDEEEQTLLITLADKATALAED